jgi:hypothetical protein
VLYALRISLLEFSTILARMWDSPDFRTMMGDYSSGVASTGVSGWGALRDLDREGAPDFLYNQLNERIAGSRLSGGPVDQTGLYKLHRGEYVVPSLPASTASTSSGGNTYHVSMVVNGSNLTQKQLEMTIYNVMDSIARKA